MEKIRKKINMYQIFFGPYSSDQTVLIARANETKGLRNSIYTSVYTPQILTLNFMKMLANISLITKNSELKIIKDMHPIARNLRNE